MVAPLPGYLLPPLGLSPVVPRKGPLVAEPETGSGAGPETIPITLSGDKVLSPPLLAAPFPFFPPGPTLLVAIGTRRKSQESTKENIPLKFSEGSLNVTIGDG